jgi:hypothetical protein
MARTLGRLAGRNQKHNRKNKHLCNSGNEPGKHNKMLDSTSGMKSIREQQWTNSMPKMARHLFANFPAPSRFRDQHFNWDRVAKSVAARICLAENQPSTQKSRSESATSTIIDNPPTSTHQNVNRITDTAIDDPPTSTHQNVNQNVIASKLVLEFTSVRDCSSTDLMVHQVSVRDDARDTLHPLDYTHDPQTSLASQMTQNSFMTFITIPKRNRTTRNLLFNYIIRTL